MKIKANAKINLTLDVCSKRDDGYHLIDSVMQSVSLCDTVSISRADTVSVECSAAELSGGDNCAMAAAKAFFERTRLSGGAHIYIEKNIPVAAGLGGGSADAAAVINGLDLLYGTGLSEKERCELGLKVGADVPFCILGGTMRVSGIGEVLTRLPDCPGLELVIVKEGVKGSTAEMYARLDREAPPHPNTSAAVTAIENGDKCGLIKNIGNSFAAVNDYSAAQKLLAETSPLCTALSGSGPSVFAIYQSKTAALNAEKHLRSLGINAFYASTRKSGTEIE